MRRRRRHGRPIKVEKKISETLSSLQTTPKIRANAMLICLLIRGWIPTPLAPTTTRAPFEVY